MQKKQYERNACVSIAHNYAVYVVRMRMLVYVVTDVLLAVYAVRGDAA